jgi:hypothetical protein
MIIVYMRDMKKRKVAIATDEATRVAIGEEIDAIIEI